MSISTSAINGSSPLVGVSRAYILEQCPEIAQTELDKAVELMSQYISGYVSQHIASDQIIKLIGSNSPVERIASILNTPPKPIQKSRSKNYSGPHRMAARTWRPYEDQRLLSGIHKFGIENWPKIAAYIGNGRTSAQAAQRWFRGLDPHISRDPWTKEEDHLLRSLVIKYGDKAWKQISENIMNRSDVQCRYRYLHLPKGKISSNGSEDTSLILDPLAPSTSPTPTTMPTTSTSVSANSQSDRMSYQLQLKPLATTANQLQMQQQQQQQNSTTASISNNNNSISSSINNGTTEKSRIYISNIPNISNMANIPNLVSLSNHQIHSNGGNTNFNYISTNSEKTTRHFVMEPIDTIICKIQQSQHIPFINSEIFSFLDQKVAELSNRPLVANLNQN